eukprot:SAG11_NODE_737_length_7431_cov_7.438762_11_plen_101_part_00
MFHQAFRGQCTQRVYTGRVHTSTAGSGASSETDSKIGSNWGDFGFWLRGAAGKVLLEKYEKISHMCLQMRPTGVSTVTTPPSITALGSTNFVSIFGWRNI